MFTKKLKNYREAIDQAQTTETLLNNFRAVCRLYKDDPALLSDDLQSEMKAELKRLIGASEADCAWRRAAVQALMDRIAEEDARSENAAGAGAVLSTDIPPQPFDPKLLLRDLRKADSEIAAATSHTQLSELFARVISLLFDEKPSLLGPALRNDMKSEMQRLISASVAPGSLQLRTIPVRNMMKAIIDQVQSCQPADETAPPLQKPIDLGYYSPANQMQRTLDQQLAEIKELTSKLAAKETQVGTLERRLRQAEQDGQTARSETEAAKKTASEAVQQAKTANEQAKAAGEQAKAAGGHNRLFNDPDAAVAYVRDYAAAGADRLAEFAGQLMRSADSILSGDAAALRKQIRLLEQVYAPCPPVTRLGAAAAAGRMTVQAIAVVQEDLHARLQQMGITPIDPARGETFDPKLHQTAEGGQPQWTDDPGLENTVYSVTKIGFQFQGQTLRAAIVRRYAALKSDGPAQEAADR